MTSSNSGSKKILRSVITSRGSQYVYLPDGRTQRHKKVTNEVHDPQDLLVFIPMFDLIKKQASEIYPSIFAGIENEVQFHQVLLEYGRHKGKTIRPIDEKGNEILTNQEAKEVEKVFLAFIDKLDKNNSFNLPVSIVPKIGYNSFDTRKFINENGESMRERHIGNKVVEIVYEENNTIRPINSPSRMR